jgi:sterol desaturase/sphingolipid hydroxylase (fatty acid hydroxylase superfamily)
MTAFLVGLATLTAVFAGVSVLERIPALRYRPQPLLRPWFATDVTWYLVSAFVAGFFAFVFRPVLAQLAVPGVSSVTQGLPVPVQLVLALLVFDLIACSVHVAIHRSDTLWAFHKVHHSSRQLDVLATTRTQPFELLIRNVPAQLALFALGFSGSLVGVAVLVFAAFGALNHSNLRLPLRHAEWLFITPRLHRTHHVPETCQHNFATIFTIWDRLGGSLLRTDARPDAALGVPGEVESFPQRFSRAFRRPMLELLATRDPREELASR